VTGARFATVDFAQWGDAVAYWSCAQLQPARTHLALRCLALAGFEVYHPCLRQYRVSHGRKIETRPPLFPGYTFVLIQLQWRAAHYAPGVIRLVMDGLQPARVSGDVISEIRSREVGGLIELPTRKLHRGDAVRIVRGPFRDQLALFDGMRAADRVLVLLQLLGTQRRFELARDAVEVV
jgi:transcriptional antiterminator RfaH